MSNDPSLLDCIAHDTILIVWMLKIAIPCLSQPMELLSALKKIWDEWARMYGALGNIDLIVDTFEKNSS